ncbi:MAG: phosphopantothenoylcysteine decarboxylase, partial [Planctomycetota bacterium]|nr:phosphopantothenoylcysteine decarboxylase [Planctomycetota bacterium]
MRFLVTAGPTHEHLDPVRFLANASSGKMGYAIAREARRRGHTVSLISGPTHLRPPKGIRLTKVISAMSMRRAIKKEIRRCHCLVMAAAVADYRPAKSSRAKIRKGKGPRSLAL